METTIEAIETRYNGYRFRSRQEARWSVMMDILGVPYRYELEGFYLGEGERYLPDFWLEEPRLWLEVKGMTPTENEIEKATKLAQLRDDTVLIYWCRFEMESFYEDNYTFCKDDQGVLRVVRGVGGLSLGWRFWDWRILLTALDAARGARFEFGENSHG